MDGLTADFDPSAGAADVKRRSRDRWRVTPPAIRVTDTRPAGGKFHLLITTRGDDWTSVQFDKMRAFAIGDNSEAVLNVGVKDDQREWLRPNQTVLIADGETTGPTDAIIVMLVAEVHSPSGEPPIDFALELLPVPAPVADEEEERGNR